MASRPVCMQVILISTCSSPRRTSLNSVQIGIVAWNIQRSKRGYASNEDLYVPGYFEMDIKKGETIVFAASTSEIKAVSLKKLFDKGSG